MFCRKSMSAVLFEAAELLCRLKCEKGACSSVWAKRACAPSAACLLRSADATKLLMRWLILLLSVLEFEVTRGKLLLYGYIFLWLAFMKPDEVWFIAVCLIWYDSRVIEFELLPTLDTLVVIMAVPVRYSAIAALSYNSFREDWAQFGPAVPRLVSKLLQSFTGRADRAVGIWNLAVTVVVWGEDCPLIMAPVFSMVWD